jgi:hypothetical protein
VISGVSPEFTNGHASPIVLYPKVYAKALKDSLKGTPSDKLRVTLASRRPLGRQET